MLRAGYFLAEYEAWRDAQLRLNIQTVSPSRALRAEMAQHAKEKIWPAWVKKSGEESGAILKQILALRDQFDWKK